MVYCLTVNSRQLRILTVTIFIGKPASYLLSSGTKSLSSTSISHATQATSFVLNCNNQDNTIEYPENGMEYPENSMEYPENGTEYPENGMEYPENGMEYPDNSVQ